MKKRKIIAGILTLAVLFNLFIINPINIVFADSEELDVTKTVVWDPNNPGEATIEIISNVPKLEDTQVLFLGSLCTSHGMTDGKNGTKDTIIESINAIAKNADVTFRLLSNDGGSGSSRTRVYAKGKDSTGKSVNATGVVRRGESFPLTDLAYVHGGVHSCINGFAIELINELENKDYDYIVLEFDSSRIADGDTMTSSRMNDLAEALAPYYAENKVIWITDGAGYENRDLNPEDRYGLTPYTPTNFYYKVSDKETHILSADHFKGLCALLAPQYYIENKNTANAFGTRTSDGKWGGKESEIITLGPSYTLKEGKRDKKDLINGTEPDYMVYSSDSRQLYYNKANELADFLYMAIQGTTLRFVDNVNVTVDDTINISSVVVSVSKDETLSTATWLTKTSLDVTTATLLTDANGIKYVTETDKSEILGEIKVTTGNDNPEDNNKINLNVQDLKNQLTYVKVVIKVTDTENFKSCTYLKTDSKGNPLNLDGNPLGDDEDPVYEMNPNDGPVKVEAFKNGKTSGTADASGKGSAKAPASPVCTITGTIEGGTQSYDTSQNGLIRSKTGDDELIVSAPIYSDQVYTFTPNTNYELDEVYIDGNKVDLSTTGTTTGTDYKIVEDATTGIVTVQFPGITEDHEVFVKFTLFEPNLSIVKTVVTPTSGSAKAGDTIKYKITVTNNGNKEATGFTITDAIDTTRVTYKSSTPEGVYDSATNVVTWSNLNLDIDASLDLYLEVTVVDTIEGTSDFVTNVAGGTYPGGTTPIPTSAPVDQPLTGRDITVTYNYVGSYAPVTKPSDVTCTYGTALTADDITAQTMPSQTWYTFDGWYLDDKLTIPFDPTLKLNGTNFATLQTGSTLPVYGKWSPKLDFSIEKKVYFEGSEVGDRVLSPGSTVKYTIVVTNNNVDAAITVVKITDTLPVGLTIVESSITNGGTYSSTEGTITWTVSIPKDDSIELTFNATIPTDITKSETYENAAAVVGGDGRPVTDVDDKVSFTAKPDQIVLSVTKDWSDKWDNHASDTVYVQLYRRTSSTDPWEKVPNGELALSSNKTSGSIATDPYSDAGDKYEFIFRELTASGGTMIDEGGMLGKYMATYAINSTDSKQTDITNVYVITKDDLEFTKSADELAAPGEVLEYTLTVKNNRGYETATNIIVTDSLPDGVTLVDPDGLVCTSGVNSSSNDKAETSDNKNITWTVEKLAPGDTATLTIKVTVSSNLTNDEIINSANIDTVGKTQYVGDDRPLASALTDVRTFEVTKVWADPAKTLDSVTVQLYQNDVAYGDPVTLTAANSWTYKWTVLPMYDTNKDRYVYTVAEVGVDAYDSEYDYYEAVIGNGNTSAKITNTIKEYVITYEFVGNDIPSGINVPSGDTVDYGTKYQSSDKPSHNDYVFEGWFTDSACTTPYVDGTEINDTTTENGKKVLYGKWTKKVEVSYEFVGDTPAAAKLPESELLVPDTAYTADSKTGSITDYTFEGWFTDKDCTTKYVDGTKISKDTVLYGKWTHNPEVSYQYVGDVPSSAVVPDSERVAPGTAYDSATKPSDDEYVFDGWFTDSGCTTKYTEGTKIYKDTLLYGKWTKKPCISYEFIGDIPDGKEPPASELGLPGANYDPSSVDVPPTHTFDGWYLDPDCTIPFVPGSPVNDDTVLYGKWTRKDGAAEYIPGAGAGPNSSDVKYPDGEVYKAGDTVPVPKDPIYDGDDYEFGGWFSDPDCTIPYTPTTIGDEGIKIYAKWNPNPLISYNLVGKVPDGFSVPKSVYLTPGTPYTSVNPQGSTTDYLFDGWYLDPACTIKYVDGTEIFENITLYGKWLPVLPKTGEEISVKAPIGLVLVAGAVVLMVIAKKKREEF